MRPISLRWLGGAFAVVLLGLLLVVLHGRPSDGNQVLGPSSALISGFVWRTDSQFGYGMLVPTGWESIHLGDARGYMPRGSTGKQDRVLLTAATLRSLPEDRDEDTLVEWLNPLRHVTGAAEWARMREDDWRRLDVQFRKEALLTNGVIYSAQPRDEEADLVAYLDVGDATLGLALVGSGKYADVDTLRDEGLLADFEAMARSARGW